MKVGFQTGANLKKGDCGEGLFIKTFQHLIDESLTNHLNGSKEALHFNSKDIYLKNNEPYAKAVSIVARNGNGHNKKNGLLNYPDILVKDFKKIKISDLDLLFVRGDDIKDSKAVSKLSKYTPLLPSTLNTINSWQSTINTKDKYDLVKRCEGIQMPRTILAHSKEDIHAFLPYIDKEKNHNYFVVKARYGSGGKQVHRINKHDPNLDALVESYFSKYDNELIVQEYNPLTEKGDLRVMMFDGDVICAVKRIPPRGKWKTNISLGGGHEPYELSKEEIEFCKEIGERYNDVRFLGLDVLSERNNTKPKEICLIEVNCNPGMTQKVKKLYNIDIPKLIFDKVGYENN